MATRFALVPLAVLAGGLLWYAPGLGLMPPLGFYNSGTSMPRGLYLFAHAQPAAVGEIVALREPPHFKLRWLLKRVEAVGGERYCWREDLNTHVVDDRPMPPPSPQAVAMGIPVWKGCRNLEADELVGYGRSATSWDSRYTGPVHMSELWGVYRGIWLVN